MDLVIDKDRKKFQQSVGNTSISANNIVFKQGDSETLNVQFISDRQVVELAAGSTGIFALKAKGDFTGNYLAYTGSWTQSGTGTSTAYSFTLDLNTTEMIAALASLDDIEVQIEIEWTESSLVNSTLNQLAVVQNDVIDTTSSGATPFPGFSHVNDTNNPHSVTAAQITGAAISTELDTALGSTRWRNESQTVIIDSSTTTSYTAVDNDIVVVLTSSAPVTITPPATGTFTVVDGDGQAATNNVTVSTGTVHSSTNDFAVDVAYGDTTFVYVNATVGWITLK